MENDPDNESMPAYIHPIDNTHIDKLTLEMFMNKKNYKKYIEKTDPNKFFQLQSKYADIKKYRGTILTITDDLLENPDNEISTEISEIFDAYTSTIIRYLKNKEIQHKFIQHSEDEIDDVLFGSIDETPHERTNSFWSGERVVKKSTARDLMQFGIPRIPSDVNF